MPIAQWDDYLSVGCDKIDGQHEKIFAYVKMLQGSIKEEYREGDMRLLIVDLYRYARFHFAEEESLMRTAAYPMIGDHISGHNEFLVGLDRFVVDDKIDSMSMRVEVVGFLMSWILDHMPYADQTFFLYLNSHDGCSV